MKEVKEPLWNLSYLWPIVCKMDIQIIFTFIFRIVCKTGPVSRRKQARIIVTIGDATVSWEMEFKYQVTNLFCDTNLCLFLEQFR